MSEDEEKNSDKDDDLLSMVDSLIDSEDETPKSKMKDNLDGTPKKTKVVPVIVRPPKKFKPRPIKIQPKTRVETALESIKQIKPVSIDKKSEIPLKKESTPELTLDELADTVLEELDTELTTPEVKSSQKDTIKFEYKVKTTTPSYEIEEPKKSIPSSYKIKFGTAQKIKSVNLDRDMYVTCPKCKHYFESIETQDIICPKCRHEFSI